MCDPCDPITNKNNTCQYSFNESNYNCNLSLENPGQDSKENPGQNSEDSWCSYSVKHKTIMSSNSALRPKEPKYKFPNTDPPPTAGLEKYSPKDLYSFIINLCYHRIPPDTYRQWCNQTERDDAFPELSKDGVLETSFSLKNQRDQFKKSLKKKEVISESNI